MGTVLPFAEHKLFDSTFCFGRHVLGVRYRLAKAAGLGHTILAASGYADATREALAHAHRRPGKAAATSDVNRLRDEAVAFVLGALAAQAGLRVQAPKFAASRHALDAPS